jgi:hypothetical protein
MNAGTLAARPGIATIMLSGYLMILLDRHFSQGA